MYLVINQEGNLYKSDKLTDDIMAGATNGLYDVIDMSNSTFLITPDDIDDVEEWVEIDDYLTPTEPGSEIGEEID